MGVAGLQSGSAPCMATVAPARSVLSRALRSFTGSGVPALRCCKLAGLLQRKSSLGRQEQAWQQQHGTFGTNRPTSRAAAAVTDVEAQPAAGPAGEERYQSAAYPFTDIEAKWQQHWEEHQTFRTPEFHELDTSKPKFYALDMFPYPR